MQPDQPSLTSLAARAAIVHTITYVVMGTLASTLLDYEAVFARPDMACWMRQVNDPVVMMGPLLQPMRGLVFGLALYPFRHVLFARDTGWLLLWWLLAALGILNTYGPASGSLEGMLYTVIPIPDQLKGYLEVVPQAGLFAYLLTYWVRHPEKKRITRTLVVVFAISIALPLLGLLARRA